MSDQPLTLSVLAEFHRDVVLPDVVKVVTETVGASERRLAARIDEIVRGFERPPLKAEVERLRVRVEALHDEIRRLDERIRRSAGE